MAVPAFEEFMLPLLRRLADGREHRLRELREDVADDLALSEADRAEMLRGGSQARYANRFYWAGIYLNRAKVTESPMRGIVRITARGTELLGRKPSRIDARLLSEYPEFRAFTQKRPEMSAVPPTAGEVVPPEVTQTPEERLERAYADIHETLAADLLERLKRGTPSFFEHVVLELMQAMGYGGFRPDAGEVVGRPGDGGIDGIIHLDKLGLETMYLQAKRWEGSVGRPEVQKFSGSLDGVRARKGVMVTTSTFAAGAIEYAASIDKRIVLVDGERLVNLMIEHGIGVSEHRRLLLMRVDGDYFEEQ